MTSAGPCPAGANPGALANKPLDQKMTISGNSPAGATSGALAHRPLSKKMHHAGARARFMLS